MTTDKNRYPQEPECIFCAIVARKAPAKIVTETGSATIIVPLKPVAEGHVLVIPHRHVRDALDDPTVTAETMEAAVHFAKHPEYHARPNDHLNLITSVGLLATQSVGHLHIHIVPRRRHDGLQLPWGDNESQSAEYERNAVLFYSGGC